MVCPMNKVSIEAPGVALSHNQLLVESVIFKTFSQYKCDVVITYRLRSLFTNKLIRMGRALQSKVDGAELAKLKNGRKQPGHWY